MGSGKHRRWLKRWAAWNSPNWSLVRGEWSRKAGAEESERGSPREGSGDQWCHTGAEEPLWRAEV